VRPPAKAIKNKGFLDFQVSAFSTTSAKLHAFSRLDARKIREVMTTPF
jgi:hypothetical protein